MGIAARLLRNRFALTLNIAIVALIACPGCPRSSNNVTPAGSGGSGFPLLPGASTIDTLTASDAVVGQNGALRVTLVDPVDADTTVTLTSSNPAVATIPATATIPAGGDNVEVVFTGVAVGVVQFTATLAGSTLSTVANVVAGERVANIFIDTPLLAGAQSTLNVSLNFTAPSDVTVTLSSSDSTVLPVPATIVIPKFSRSHDAPVTAGSPGSAILTATLGSSTVTQTVNVVTSPIVTSILTQSASGTVLLNQPLQLTITLDVTVTSDTDVALTSSNSTVIAVPATVTVPAGSRTISLSVTPLAAGNAIITASLNGSSRLETVRVVAAPSVNALAISSQLQVGVPSVLTVFLDANVLSDTVVTLTSSNGGVLTVPASITIPAGSTNATVVVTPVVTGSTLITATLGSSSVDAPVSVVQTSTLNFVSVPPTLQVGAVTTISVALSAPVSADTTVTFTAANPAVVTVPASSIIQAGRQSAAVSILAVAVGTTTIQVATLGATFVTPVVVVAAPSLATLSADPVRAGLSAFLTVTADSIVAADTTVTLANSAPGVLTVPATAVIPAGEQRVTVPITGVAASPPNATITGTLNGTTTTVTITVLP